MVDSQRGAPHVVGFNPTSASGIIILLEQSGQGTSAFHMSHVYQNCQLSNGLHEWKIKKLQRWTLLKPLWNSRILHIRTTKRNSQIMRTKKILKRSCQNYCEFGFLVQLQKENYSLYRHSETHAKLVWHRQLVLLNETRSYTDAWIAVVNGYIPCICS